MATTPHCSVPLDDVCSAVGYCLQVVAMIKELLETRIRPAVQVGSTRADPAHPSGIGTAPPADLGDGCIAAWLCASFEMGTYPCTIMTAGGRRRHCVPYLGPRHRHCHPQNDGRVQVRACVLCRHAALLQPPAQLLHGRTAQQAGDAPSAAGLLPRHLPRLTSAPLAYPAGPPVQRLPLICCHTEERH